MIGLKSLFVCVLIVSFGSSSSPARAQTPAVASPKQADAPSERIAAEKSVLAESSKQAPKPEAAATDFCRCVGDGDNSVTKRIEKALSAPIHQTGLDYADQPLQDVVTQLADEYEIPIQLNKAALEEAGIGTDTKITVNIHNISLRSALRLMLKSSQLTYIIENEVLLITTKEDAEKDLKLCVYDVRRLAGDNGDLTQLIDIISSCVCADTWAKNGKGMAEIRAYKPGLLVISQTHLAHEEIRKLLTTLDEMRNGRPAEASEAPRPASTVVPRKVPAPTDSVPTENPFSG